jgi:hypothetical protein
VLEKGSYRCLRGDTEREQPTGEDNGAIESPMVSILE